MRSRLLTALVASLALASTALGCAATRECRSAGDVFCLGGEVVCTWDEELGCEVCTCEKNPNDIERNPEHGPAPPPN